MKNIQDLLFLFVIFVWLVFTLCITIFNGLGFVGYLGGFKISDIILSLIIFLNFAFLLLFILYKKNQ